MKRRILLGVGALAIGLGAFWWLQQPQHQWRAAGVPSAAAAVPVIAALSVARDMPIYVDGLGTVQAYNTVTVRSRVDGQIMQAFFVQGQHVNKGDPLFQIDPRPYQAALDQAIATKEKDEAALVDAKLQLARYARLVTGGYQTQQAYDSENAQVGEIEAAIKADQAAIDMARLNLDYADIRSPLDGLTGARLVDPGNLIHAATNTDLVTITQMKPIYVDFTVPQRYLSEIRRNQARSPLVVQALDADAGTILDQGKLSLIDNEVDPATDTVELKATFDNDKIQLWPGQFVDARLILSMREGVVTVPAQAVQQGPNGYYAYVVEPDRTAQRRTLQIGGFQNGQAVVTSGLAPGEKVVVEGQYRLTPGAKVEVAAGGRASANG
jgi:multidrug efflux system membrane fusion protein